MKPRYESDWEQIHFGSVLVDLHAHPSLNVSLFHRTLASRLPRLTHRLLVAGYSPADIQKILGGNALRVLREGWKR